MSKDTLNSLPFEVVKESARLHALTAAQEEANLPNSSPIDTLAKALITVDRLNGWMQKPALHEYFERTERRITLYSPWYQLFGGTPFSLSSRGVEMQVEQGLVDLWVPVRQNHLELKWETRGFSGLFERNLVRHLADINREKFALKLYKSI